MVSPTNPGSPCWLDLGVPDMPAAADFYRTVFEWDYETVSDTGDYALFRVDGKVVAALGKLTEEGAKPAWMLYFHTPDAQAAASLVQESGGTVRVAPLKEGDEGVMAQFTDPQGAEFAVFQPGSMTGLEWHDQPNSLTWTELYTTNASAAKTFYGSLLGWRTEDMPMPDGETTYSLISPPGTAMDKQIGGIAQMPSQHLPSGKAYWHPVFQVRDCDESVARVRRAGGSLPMEPMDMEDVGRMAICHDPFDAEFMVLQPAPMG